MSESKKLTIEDDVKNSDLSESMQKQMMNFITFINRNGFSIKPEDDGNGWQIIDASVCIGHMNFPAFGIWIDTCDFGNGDSANDILKEMAWAHVRVCEHYTSDGKQCGCGNQPGSTKKIFGRTFNHLCFALLEFLNPDADTLAEIEKLMLLLKQ